MKKHYLFEQGYRTLIGCADCGDAVYSLGSGAFASCKCDSVFVDQTESYMRIGGTPQDSVIIKVDMKGNILEFLADDSLKA